MAITTATALAIGSLAATGVSTAASFGQARAQRKLQDQADRKAAEMMAEARKKLEVNVYEELAIAKEPYELQREALLTQGATALQAGVEGEARGAAATAGRVQLAQQAGQAQTRAAMSQEIRDLEKLTAAEESRLRDIGVQLDLGEVEGAQLASREAAINRAQAMQQGIQGATSFVQQGLQFIPLYSQNKAAQQQALGQMEFSPDEFAAFGNVAGGAGGLGEAGEGFSNLDFEAIGQMSPKQFRQFNRALTPQQRQMLYMNQQYTDLYQNPFAQAGFGITNP
jgi:hypothetical protein